MKKNYIVSLLSLVLIVMATAACRNQSKEQISSGPLHMKRDTGLNFLLKPVNEQVIANIPVIRAQKGSSIFISEVQGRVAYDTRNQLNLASRVSGRIEKLYIKYNYQPVKKGQLIMEIYSPDLAAAQRELLLIQSSGNQDRMLEPAKQRLKLLGMASAQINRVLHTNKISYKVPVFSNGTGFILETQATASAVQPTAEPSNSAVLLREGQYLAAGENVFTIYRSGDLVAEFSLSPDVASKVKKQAKVLIQRTANMEQTLTGKIGLIQPFLNAGENFVLARVYMKDSGLQPGELVTGQIPFLSEKAFWLPKLAVVSTGNQFVVFKKEGSVFIPKTVKTGVTQNNQIQVFNEIGGWDVAKNAHYLVDSESFIRTSNREK